MKLLAIAIVLFCSGCVTLPPEAAKIQVHDQYSNMLDKCKNLGPVQASGSAMWSGEQGFEIAKVGIREAAGKLGGDTVAIVSSDRVFGKAIYHGVAFKCFEAVAK